MEEVTNSPKSGQQSDQATLAIILNKAITLFAARGFKGVTMRDLAKESGITPAALYYYFTDKQSLHMAALAHAHARSRPAGVALLNPAEGGEPLERLEKFIYRLCERYHNDPEFLMLVQRSLIDSSEEPHKSPPEALTKNFSALQNFLSDLAPDFDSHLLTVSVFGLISHTYNTRMVRHGFPGNKAEHDSPAVVTKHIMKLLTRGILPAATKSQNNSE